MWTATRKLSAGRKLGAPGSGWARPPPASRWQSRAQPPLSGAEVALACGERAEKLHATAASSGDDAQNCRLEHRPPTADTPFLPLGRRVSSKT